MPGADKDPLGPDMEERLRRELDAVQPRFSSPRYLSAGRRPGVWRFAPAALAAAIVGIVGLAAFAGSPNPVVWTEHVVTVLHPQTSPTATPAAASPMPSPSSEGHETPEPSESAEPKDSPEPSGSPEPRESPEPSGGESQSGSGGTDSHESGGTSGGTSGGDH
jgi:hypothetical protein